MKQKEFNYTGAINNIDKILENLSTENIFLVHGNQSYIKSGAKKSLSFLFQKYTITEFYKFSVNPKLEEAEIGYEIFKQSKSNLIIAVGGGSTIDMAKIIKYLAMHNIKLNKNNDALPIIAIPTTAGTGSEATHFAVVYIDGIKHSYEEKYLLPDIAIIDANLLQGQSKYQMAVSGIDAFAQSIESLWSINSTEESQYYAKKAIQIIWKNLKNAIDGNKEAQIKLSQGSFWAGKAINMTKTTAPHALSYGFTENFGLPHGHAVALFLPFFIDYHLSINDENCNDVRGASYVKAKIEILSNLLSLESSILTQSIANYIQECNIEIRFTKLGISESDFHQALKKFSQARLNNNPAKITFDIAKSIFYFKYNN